MIKSAVQACLCLFLPTAFAHGGTYFLEAESFHTAGGWVVATGPTAKRASGVAMLGGAGGSPKGTASTVVNVQDAGRYRVWVRYVSHPKWRGPFRMAASVDGRELGGEVFDTAPEGKNNRDPEVWKSFEVVLPQGQVTLTLSKHENKNSNGISRLVDCVLLTMDENLVPNHLHFGAQTFVRVTLGDGYDKPTYLHIYADHYHAPWYKHFYLARNGGGESIAPAKANLMKSGERSAWCNVTPLIYQDSGAMFFITARHSYYDYADRLRVVLEFATAPDEKAIVRTLHVDNQPGGLAVYLPPNLLTPENTALLKTNREVANETGKLADAYVWPTHGKRPERFPFFVTAQIGDMTDADVAAREQKTLDYFGFTPRRLRQIHGIWYALDNSYCRPDLEKMKSRAAHEAAEFKSAGGDVKQIVCAHLMDEPTGQGLELMAKDAAYLAAFRNWLKKLGLTPADLLVADWSAVRIITMAERDEFPSLYYFSQRFRTRALGDFMTVQRKILEEAYGGSLKALANFSDGAIYTGNFYTQGVDYFELLDDPAQNAIWGEDWANGSSTYQCASFNVDLMRSAARKHGQVIGHHLVAHAGRKPWDVKLKATSELARGVKIFNNFAYGPSWATHEGGQYWRSHVWYAKPETWTANASITREVGAVEDLLVEAMPARAKTALLYSSAGDVWSLGGNLAYGFDRMHTWLALVHEQVPVDVVHESQAATGDLDGYAVCYLSSRHLSRAAAEKLQAWVRSGGVLWMTAGAATYDEFNRPLESFASLLPADRGECRDLQTHTSAGRYLRLLAPQGRVRWNGGEAQVFSVKQSLSPRSGGRVLAHFEDDSPAIVRGDFGKGRVYCAGFLPALSYIKPALDRRLALEEKAVADPQSISDDESTMLQRSTNPWEFPAEVRALLMQPVHETKISKPIECSIPLVDAVYMTHPKGILIPLANYTNRPIESVVLDVQTPQQVVRADSATHGQIRFERISSQRVRLALPLENNDFIKLYWK